MALIKKMENANDHPLKVYVVGKGGSGSGTAEIAQLKEQIAKLNEQMALLEEKIVVITEERDNLQAELDALENVNNKEY